MKHYWRKLFGVFVICLVLTDVGAVARAGWDIPAKEEVQLTYELLLTKCRGPACHTDSAAKGQVNVLMEKDESELYGWSFVERKVGDLEYQLRFFAGHELTGRAYGRGLRIGFAGRTQQSDSKQMTWAQKKFTAEDWSGLPAMSVSGTPYTADMEQVTPTLRVNFLKTVKDLSPVLPPKTQLQLSYDLTLTRCKGDACRLDPPRTGSVRLSLYFLDASSSWGVATVTEREVAVTYEVRISGESEPKGDGFEKTLTIGFTGRLTKSSDKQVAWAAKSFKAKEWNALPPMSISGEPYSEAGERVTPTLSVRVVNAG